MSAWLTIPQVAERLQLNEQHVRRLIRRGELKASNIGGDRRPSYRVEETAVEEFLEARAVTT